MLGVYNGGTKILVHSYHLSNHSPSGPPFIIQLLDCALCFSQLIKHVQRSNPRLVWSNYIHKPLSKKQDEFTAPRSLFWLCKLLAISWPIPLLVTLAVNATATPDLPDAPTDISGIAVPGLARLLTSVAWPSPAGRAC